MKSQSRYKAIFSEIKPNTRQNRLKYWICLLKTFSNSDISDQAVLGALSGINLRILNCAIISLGLSLIFQARPSCAQTPSVVVGGVSGLTSLIDPEATAAFRSRPGTGLYIHYSATDPNLFGSTMRALARNFAGRSSIAELALGGGFNPLFWSNGWKSQVLKYGFTPKIAIVNEEVNGINSQAAISNKERTDFTAFITSGRKIGGVEIFAPIASPNQSGGTGIDGDANTLAIRHPWNDTWWDGLKAMAKEGGGIALDAPPAFFLHGLPDAKQTKAYQEFEEAVLRWAALEHLWSAEIISPYFDGVYFQADSEALYQILKDSRTLPETWVIENYDECGEPFPRRCINANASFLAPVGTESQSNTVSAVALWFAKNADTAH